MSDDGGRQCRAAWDGVSPRSLPPEGHWRQVAFVGGFCETVSLYSPVLGRCFDGHYRFHDANRALTLP
jgi:hypothetical protein